MPKKKSFILYADYIKHIERLSDDEAGKLFKAIFCYVNNGRLPDLDGMSAMAFSFISNQLDNDLQKYEETCKKRSENIKKKQREICAIQTIQMNTNVFFVIQTILIMIVLMIMRM